MHIPSFPDKTNFGRVTMNIASKDLYMSLKQQISDFLKAIYSENTQLNDVKSHGGLCH